jgi:hypothetical protein
MVAGNEGFGLGPVGAFVDRRGGEHGGVDAQLRQDDIVRTGKVQSRRYPFVSVMARVDSDR